MLRRGGAQSRGNVEASALRPPRWAAQFLLFSCLVLRPVIVLAQAAAPADPMALPPAYPANITSPVPATADELHGKELLRALRGGGFLLFMRHAQAGDTRANCPDEAVLTEVGESQARTVGAAISQLKLPVMAVQASETCRARETANLLGVAPVAANPALNPGSIRGKPYDFLQKFSYLLVPPPSGSNLILVSHVQEAPTREDRILIELAEIVVYRAKAGTRAVPVARIPARAWKSLIAADAS